MIVVISYYDHKKLLLTIIMKKIVVLYYFSPGRLLPRSPQMENSIRELELGEREEEMATMSQRNTALCMSKSFSSFLKVSFTLHNIIQQFLLNSLRFACGWEVCWKSEKNSKENFYHVIWLEAEDVSEEGEDFGLFIWLEAEDFTEEEFRGNKWIESSENSVTINIFIINLLFHNFILNFPVEGA